MMEISRSQMKEILGAIPLTAIIYEVTDGRYVPVAYSPDTPGFTGNTEEEYVARYKDDMMKIVADSDRAALSAVIGGVTDGNGDSEATYRIHHATKGFVWTHVRFRLIGTCNGRPLLLGVHSSVSEVINEPEILLNNSSQKIYVIERDTYELLFSNSTARAGKAGSPLLGQSCYQYIRGKDTPCTDCVAYRVRGMEPLEVVWQDASRDRKYNVKAVPLTFFGKNALAFFIDDLTQHLNLEQLLENEKKKYRAATEGANLRVYEYDIRTHSISMPPYAAKLFGVEENIPNVPESIVSSFRDEDHDRVREFFARVDSGEKQVRDEFLMKETNGCVYRLKYTFTTVCDNAGVPLKAYAVAEDVTAEREIEYAYNTFLKNLLSQKHENEICSFHINLTRNLSGDGITNNEYFLAFQTGGTFDALIEASCRIIAFPEERQYYREHFSREALISAFEDGKREVSHIFRDYYDDGRIHWTNTIVNMMRNPRTGEIEGVIFGLDVSDAMREKLVIQRLTHDEFDLIAIIEISEDTIEFTNVRTDVFTENPARYKKYAEYTGKCIMEIVAPEDREDVAEKSTVRYISERLAEADTYSIAFSTIMTDGSRRRKQLRYSYLDENRKQILLIQTDVTDIFIQEQNQKNALRVALEEARRADAAKSEFLSRISHDIRTPMNGIIGMTYIARKQENPPETAECLEKIDTSSKFLLGLINDVLDMSKVESGMIELHPEPYLMSDFDRYIDSVIKPLYEAKNQTFTAETHPVMDVIPIVDILRFNQIIFNILSNAVKYTPEGGSISLRVYNELVPGHRERVRAVISDNGIGMSEEFQKVIFDPFTQDRRSYTADSRGSGLGLAIVRELVELMGGTVSVKSSPGQGSTFTVVIDFDYITADQHTWHREEEMTLHDYGVLGGRHVLLCEDHPMNQEIASTLLNARGMIVETAENGQAGVDMFRNSGDGFYDIILMDIRMPLMNGYEAAAAIRKLARRDAAEVPILAMTADAFADDIQKCLDAGMNGHIAKPVNPEEMYRKMAELISLRTEAD